MSAARKSEMTKAFTAALRSPTGGLKSSNFPRPLHSLGKFSVNLASRITQEEQVRHLCEILQRPAGGIVLFNCRVARELGFDTRLELDENFPDNTAHAHVYYDGSRSSRKKAARQLDSRCQVIRKPQF